MELESPREGPGVEILSIPVRCDTLINVNRRLELRSISVASCARASLALCVCVCVCVRESLIGLSFTRNAQMQPNWLEGNMQYLVS